MDLSKLSYDGFISEVNKTFPIDIDKNEALVKGYDRSSMQDIERTEGVHIDPENFIKCIQDHNSESCRLSSEILK